MKVRCIHQTWKDRDPPPRLFRQEWSASWRELNPGWDFKFWTNRDIAAFVENEYPDFFPTWLLYPKSIMRIDAWRYLLLKLHGGLYVDLDFLCLHPLDEWLSVTDRMLCGDEGGGSCCNAFLWAPAPNLPFFDGIEEALIRTETLPNVIHATGPGFLSGYAAERSTLLEIAPRELLYPVAWHEHALLEELKDQPRSALADIYPQAKAMTFWSASWVEEAQRRRFRKEWDGPTRKVAGSEEDGKQDYGGQPVFVELSGGLGDQIFQFAHGCAHSVQIGRPLELVVEGGGSTELLDAFGIQARPRSDGVSGKPDRGESGDLSGSCSDNPSSFVLGRFRHERYFEGLAPEILGLLRASLSTQVNKLPVVGIHLSPALDRDEDLPCVADYLLAAVAVMKSALPGARYIVYCLAADAPLVLPTTCAGVYELRQFGSEFALLEALCSCKGLIISRGVLGFWAAWISRPVWVIHPGGGFPEDSGPTTASWISVPPQGTNFPRIRLEDSPPKRADPFLEAAGIPVSDEDAYWSAVEAGLGRMQQSKVVLCALARDLSSQVTRSMLRLEELGMRFREYRIVVYENDSSDETAAELEKWAEENPNVVVISETLKNRRWPSCKSRRRMEHMAEYRSRYQAAVRSDFASFDHVIVFDTDLPGGTGLYGIANTFGHDDWDFVGSLSLRDWDSSTNTTVHHDSWAFRSSGDWKPVGGWFYGWIPGVGAPLAAVGSCFGGCGVYRMEAFLSGSYDGGDCEHVTFHRSMTEKGHGRIFLNPSMVSLY